MNFKAEISLKNPRPEPIDVTIPRGMILEVKDPTGRIQNLVVAKDYSLVLGAYSSVTVPIECFCVNRSFSPPKNTPMNVTPFFAKVDLKSQEATWQYFSPSP